MNTLTLPIKRSLIKRSLISLAGIFLLASCGGGGGGGGSSSAPLPPTATLSASAADVKTNATVTLTWSSSNATSCLASGDWSGALAVSGSQSLSVAKSAVYSITCTGAVGQTSGSANVTTWDVPTAKISSSDAEILTNNAVTITWSSQNAKSCTVTGLGNATGLSGTETSATLTTVTPFEVSCSNPVFDAVKATTTVNVSSTYKLTVTASHERPGASVLTDVVLVDGRISSVLVPQWEKPARVLTKNVYIELQLTNGDFVAGSYASDVGAVIFSGLDPSQKYVPVIKSKVKNAAGFDLWVVNNFKPLVTASTIRSRYAPYEDKAATYVSDTKKVNQALEVTAALGWDPVAKKLDDTKRFSAPYVILTDVMEQQSFAASNGAVNKVNSLSILWSFANKGGGVIGENNYDIGLVSGSGGFSASGGGYFIGPTGKVSYSVGDGVPHIFLSGAQSTEVMEHSAQITVHEMTHFTQNQSQRNSSTGGSHSSSGEWQDITLVQHEGLATGSAVLVAKSPKLSRVVYSPSRSVLIDSVADYSLPSFSGPFGWFQERSVIQLIWQLFDPAGTTKLSAQKIIAPYYSDTWKNGVFTPNIWAYGLILKQQNPSLSGAIDAIGTTLNITLAGNDIWGSTETIIGNRASSQTFPVFTRVPLSGSVSVCSVGTPNEYNKLSNRRYLRFEGDGTNHRYTVTGVSGVTPYMGIGYTKNSNSLFFDKNISTEGFSTWVGECTVTRSPDPKETDGICRTLNYTPPAQTCWTITVTKP